MYSPSTKYTTALAPCGAVHNANINININVASLSIFYRHYFGKCSSELAQQVPLPYSQGRSIRYSDRLQNFSLTMLQDVTRISMSTVSILVQLDSGILCL